MLLLNQVSKAQVYCIPPDVSRSWSEERSRLGLLSSRSTHDWLNSPVKLVRVNIHFMLKSDGTGNFTETGNLGLGIESGYTFAKNHVAAMNLNMETNPKMNILPNNTTPNIDKHFRYVLDAVYFVRNDNTFLYRSIYLQGLYPSIGHSTDNVLNVFLQIDTTTNAVGGRAEELSHASKIKYTEDRNYYTRYLAYVNSSPGTDYYSWAISNANSSHELGHLYGLSHTVRYNHAPKCPTIANNGFVDPNCDDGCGDTPSAWDVTDLNNSGKHPACGWSTGGDMWCSNNLMDYNGSEALTPCQLDIIHSALDGGMKSYTVCDAVKNNLNLTIMGYPQIGYYGKNVAIKPLSIFGTTINPVLNGINRAEVYFNESVTMENFEIKDQAEFEVIYSNLCP